MWCLLGVYGDGVVLVETMNVDMFSLPLDEASFGLWPDDTLGEGGGWLFWAFRGKDSPQ